MSEELREQGAPEPRPLRAAHALMGLDGLTVAEKQRVEAANLIYQNAVVLLYILFQIQAIVSLENPERSWLWALLAFLINQRGHDKFSTWYFGLDDVTFDACMHGGSFPKTTRLKCTTGIFRHLEARCSGDHNHARWTVRKKQGLWHFDTADEAIYPRTLAKRMVEAVVGQFQPTLFQRTYRNFCKLGSNIDDTDNLSQSTLLSSGHQPSRRVTTSKFCLHLDAGEEHEGEKERVQDPLQVWSFP